MTDKPPTTVNVPESEVARQATDALGGYVYQFDQTVMTWLTLDEDEVLHIEFAEDLAVSGSDRLDLSQVKRIAMNITLRSDGVGKLITAVWDFQKNNSARRVTGALLTTSGIGKEKDMSFPGDVPGLIYWRTAARAGADVEPIRSALLCLALPKDLHTFISDAPADELRARIIRPLRWLENRPSPDELRREVEEQLIYLGTQLGVPAVPVKNTRDFLVGALLDSIKQPAAKRYVTKADLIEIFEKNTLVTVPPNLFQGLASPGMATPLTPVEQIVRDVAEVPVARRAASRAVEVKQLQLAPVLQGSVWFHGSSGLGKTTLALLLARSQQVSWRIVDLREMPASAVRSILTGIASTFRQTKAHGLILDDIPADADNSLISAVGQVARAVADVDGSLIITSMKPPQPTLASRLGMNPEAIIHVPYLTEEDVSEMVQAAGGDPQKWARPIRAFAGGGHPQLVDARIAGLEQRGWDVKEILADIVPLKNTPNDMAEERKAVRSRLLQELKPTETDLLLRLSLLHGNFDRHMAMVVADTRTKIPKAGLIFDFLVGPWIEQLGPERYRISPLLNDSGKAGLSAPLQVSIKTRVMKYLIGQNPFPADQLLQVFLIALQQNNREGLNWFGHAIMVAAGKPKESQFKRLAQEVLPFALFDRGSGKLLIPGDIRLSTLLRFAQLRVAIAADDMKQAAILVDRALAENIPLNKPVQRRMRNAMVYMMVMLEPQIPIEPKRWLPMLQDLVATPEMHEIFAQPLLTDGLFGSLPPAASHEEMFFIVRASATKSIEQLSELIKALEQQPKAVRDRYLSAAARTNRSLHMIVSASWLAEVKRPDFDPRAASATYHKLSQSESAKDNPDLAVELLCAQAIMLDDYANDKDGALEVLRAAQEIYPNDYRLNRQRQKVFYHHDQHAEALAEFEKFQDRFPKERTVDRAHAMREAGRSAAETGDLARARNFFSESWESARLCGDVMKPMTAGLSADCAILEFDIGNKDNALDLMRRALLEADDLDPSAGLNQAFVKRIHIAAILYMRGAASDFPTFRQARIYGMCSDPAPQEWFREQRQSQPALVWYELAELEAEISRHRTVLAELRKRTVSGGLLLLETTLTTHLAEAAARELDVDHFLEVLNSYPRAIVEGVTRMQTQVGFDPFNMPMGNLAPIGADEWKNFQISESTKHAVLAFMLACATKGRADLLAELRAKILAVPGLAEVVGDLFRVMDTPSDDKKDINVIIPSIVGRILKDDIITASDAYLSAIYAIQLLDGSPFARPVAAVLMSYYERLWPEILEKRSFSVRGPQTNGPIILAALENGETPMQRMANMILATEAAARPSLSNDLRVRLSKIAAKRSKPQPMAQG